MADTTAFLLDAANIVGGLLLAMALLRDVPGIGTLVVRSTAVVSPFRFLVGVLGLVAGGYHLLVHLTSGPHVFHFELAGIGVGVALLRTHLLARLGRSTSAATDTATRAAPDTANLCLGTGVPPVSPPTSAPNAPDSASPRPGPPRGADLLLTVFGLIALMVGVQGLFTPNS